MNVKYNNAVKLYKVKDYNKSSLSTVPQQEVSFNKIEKL